MSSLAIEIRRLRKNYVGDISRVKIAVLVLLVVFSCLTANPFLSGVGVFAIAVIWLGAFSSPFQTILAAFLSVQWLQASMKIWIADVYGIDLSIAQFTRLGMERAFFVESTTYEAVLLALAGIVMLSIGSRIVAPRVPPFLPEMYHLSERRLVAGYFVLFLLSRIAGPFFGGGLAQGIIILGDLRLVFPLLLLFKVVVTGRGRAALFFVVTFELIAGFMGFFAGFKPIIISLGVGLLVLAPGYWPRVRKTLVILICAAIPLGALWTFIKPIYRQILSQGNGQVIVIDVADRLGAFTDLAAGVSVDNMKSGVLDLGLRIAYVDYFADVLNLVPESIPYEKGKLWSDAIDFVMRPRLFFPDKPPLPSDSERTRYYTGRNVASGDQGTSISIGYVGESYIDFGIYGVLAIPFLLGVGYAMMARSLWGFNRRKAYSVYVCSLIILFDLVAQFEISNTKLVPGILWRWIMGAVVLGVMWRFAQPWLCYRRQGPLVTGSNAALRSFRSR